MTEHALEAARVWLTISLFRAGLNAEACRLVKDLGLRSGAQALDRVAGALYPDPGDRRREVDRARIAADRAIDTARRRGFLCLAVFDEAYPPLLREICDPPVVLWVKGNVERLAAPAVGVVGSRDATPASLAVARRLGRELSEAGVVVVSGLARGVDGAAHAGALEGTGYTVAVLGSGLDVVYPAQHRLLADRVTEAGAVVTELPPWLRPVGRHFPLRNRIISGLSKAVVVVEASEQSGSLITARLASEQGRDVLAVPGGILSGRHRGSNLLIKDGARLVETVQDVLEEIGWQSGPPALPLSADANSLSESDLERVMAAGEPYAIDDLAGLVDRPAPEMLAELSVLELAGRVVRLQGGQFMRLPAARRRTSRTSGASVEARAERRELGGAQGTPPIKMER